MHKRPLILLSGGVDSTLLAQIAVKTGYGFDYIYVRGGQGPDKIAAETAAVKEIAAKLDAILAERRQDLAYSCTKKEAVVGFDSFFEKNFPSRGFLQAYAWFFGAMSAADPANHSSVQIGYIAGDQISPALHRLKTAWELLWPIFKLGELVPLEFPLADEYRTKAYVLENIDPELYTLCWACEIPEQSVLEEKTVYLECGKCPGCVGRKVELLRMELTRPRDTILRATVHDLRKLQVQMESDAIVRKKEKTVVDSLADV